MTEDWTCLHFSLSNPQDDRSDDLPKLLRRVSEEIEARGIGEDILDVTLSEDLTAEGSWWAATVYWSSEDGGDAAAVHDGSGEAGPEMAYPAETTWRELLADDFMDRGRGVRLTRSIEGADVLQGYVVGLGQEWALLALLAEARLDGYAAVRLRDVARLQPLANSRFHRRVLEERGAWPPVAPPSIDLDSARGFIETVHAHGGLVNLQSEREDPDVAFIGVPRSFGDRSVTLQEVTTDATWDGTLSEWPYDEVTRVQFGGTYEEDLLLVAGKPPTG